MGSGHLAQVLGGIKWAFMDGDNVMWVHRKDGSWFERFVKEYEKFTKVVRAFVGLAFEVLYGQKFVVGFAWVLNVSVTWDSSLSMFLLLLLFMLCVVNLQFSWYRSIGCLLSLKSEA